MNKIMSSKELCDKAISIAKNYKTLYVMGAFGCPLTPKNKARYSKNNSYNKQAARQKMINNATDDTFGFDCVCLIKGILWGWNGDKNKTYGGSNYASTIGDITIKSMVSTKYSEKASSNFNNIVAGELVYLKDYGHIGIYIGDGLVVESTPAWDNKVQITACKNIGIKKGYNARKWDYHCKALFIDYIEEPKPVPTPTPVPVPTDELTPGKYTLIYSKCIRRQPKLGNNIISAEGCTPVTKKELVSQKGQAKLKAGTTITCNKIIKESGKRTFGSYGNCYVCIRNIDGSMNVKKVG